MPSSIGNLAEHFVHWIVPSRISPLASLRASSVRSPRHNGQQRSSIRSFFMRPEQGLPGLNH